MSKVIVGMSGGVDSAVAAYLLQLSGYEVIGVTLKTWQGTGGADSRCCEIDDAQRIADTLDIPYYVINCMSGFRENIVVPFMDAYLEGMTPNPCVLCNRCIKWDKLMSAAKTMGADYVATGHYARIIRLENGRYTVKTAEFASKDQTYMLYRLSQEQLSATLMPLGGLSKDEVREIARGAGLGVADKPDSQEICFVTDGNYTDFIEENSEREIPGEGDFVDTQGNVLGRHRGIIHYTVGQRKGLGLPLGYPAFVRKIDAGKNEVVIGRKEEIYSREILCEDTNFLSIPAPSQGERIRCRAKIRYHHSPREASIEMTGSDKLRVLFDEPVPAAAPGQSAVFYDDNDCVIGGGIITESIFGDTLTQ